MFFVVLQGMVTLGAGLFDNDVLPDSIQRINHTSATSTSAAVASSGSPTAATSTTTTVVISPAPKKAAASQSAQSMRTLKSFTGVMKEPKLFDVCNFTV